MNRRGFLTGLLSGCATAAVLPMAAAGDILSIPHPGGEYIPFSTENLIVKATQRYHYGWVQYGQHFLLTPDSHMTPAQRVISDKIRQETRDLIERMTADILNRHFDAVDGLGV